MRKSVQIRKENVELYKQHCLNIKRGGCQAFTPVAADDAVKQNIYHEDLLKKVVQRGIACLKDSCVDP